MKIAAYTRYELLRTVRNKRFMILALGFPLVLYFLIAVAEPARARTSAGRASRRRSTSWSGSSRSAR